MIERVFFRRGALNIMLEECRQPIKSVLLLVVFFLLLIIPIDVQAKEQGSVVATKELKELAEKIKAAENGLSNIKIESDAWVETKTSLSDPCEPWQRTPIYWSSTAWFTGNWSCQRWSEQSRMFERHIEGKARVDVHDEVLEAQESVFPYGELSYSVGFDGQYGRTIYKTGGRPGKTYPHKEGKLLPYAPESLAIGPAGFTGIGFSLQFFESEIYKFSKLFELASDPNSKIAAELKFTREEFEGIECIKISSKFGSLMYWLDPSHGFALRGKKFIDIYEDGHEELVELVKVTKLKEVSHGVWWPVEVSHVSRPYEHGKPWRRFVYCASNVVANDPNFDESIFTVPFPDGYLIDDQVAGIKYRVGEDPNAPKK
jgi:hypothetical protein